MHQNRGILLLENEPNLRAALLSLFKKAHPGTEVAFAENGESALSLLEGGKARPPGADPRFGLVVSDILLAGRITGVDLWRIARQRWPNVEFALISELPDAFFRGMIEDGEVAPLYLEKPFNPAKLQELVRKAA